MVSISEIKDRINQQLDNSEWWSRLSGSQFINGLSLFLSQIVKWCENAASRALQESHLSQATLRSSILAGAEDTGYTGLLISPSWGTSLVENNSDERITLPALSTVMSQSLIYYTLQDAIDLAPGESIEVETKQLWIEQITVTVSDAKAWMSYVLPKDTTALTNSIDVYVDDVLWTHRYKFRNSNPDSQVYMQYYKSTDQLGIRFGDGIKGAIPPEGAVIRFDIWCTNGETTLIDGQQLQFVEDNEYLNELLTVTTATAITGGAPQEDIESIRAGALYTTPYDDQTVWNDDYDHFIKSNIAGVVWLSVWGEAEQEELAGASNVDFINQIYISAYSNLKDDAMLGDEILALFEDNPGFNKEYNYVIRKEAPYTVSITGFAFAHSNPVNAENLIKTKLAETYGKDVKKKPHRVYEQDIWDLVNDLTTEAGIDEFTVELTDLTDIVPIDTYSYMDVDASTISFAYREAD
ncbi:TPA: hypothetical protein L3N15_004205 [Vibrio parahaemolyticus]|nr:hypothetical protein [Vibrio parahaemolyticus]